MVGVVEEDWSNTEKGLGVLVYDEDGGEDRIRVDCKEHDDGDDEVAAAVVEEDDDGGGFETKMNGGDVGALWNRK